MMFEATVNGRSIRVEVRGADGRYVVQLEGGQRLDVDLHEIGRDFMSLLIEGRSYEVGIEAAPSGYRIVFPDDALQVDLFDATRGKAAPRRAAGGPARITAPMPGKLVRVLVAVGDAVASGQGLLVMEAMKMENELRSPRAGIVRELTVREGQPVEGGALLAVVD